MSIELSSIKEFLRVDGAYEDGVINSLINAGISELKISGVSERTEKDDDYPLYELAIKVFVSQNYESRGLEEQNNKVLQNLILKLKDYPAEE